MITQTYPLFLSDQSRLVRTYIYGYDEKSGLINLLFDVEAIYNFDTYKNYLLSF